jgi:LmbE family N-acetylglucosaminyl deacetylase
MTQGSKEAAWARLTHPEFGLASPASISEFQLLVLAAHPDDETIGASAALKRCRNKAVVYLTDGAPHDKKLWSAGGDYSREEYARLRRNEAQAALQRVGIPEDRIQHLPAVDQESIFGLQALTLALAARLRRYRPDFLITHAYEGGHPDHDSAALVAALAVDSLSNQGDFAPELLEMTSYHARDGKCFAGEFLPRSSAQAASSTELVFRLSPEEILGKAEMMDCYPSQRMVLQSFPLGTERLRPAPAYNFREPPHRGKLWYECMGWPMTGKRWRELAAQAVAEPAVDRLSPDAIGRAHVLDRA